MRRDHSSQGLGTCRTTSAQRRLKTGAAHALLMRSARINKAVLKLISPRFGQRAERCGAACNGLPHGSHRYRDGPSQRHDDRTSSALAAIHGRTEGRFPTFLAAAEGHSGEA